MKIKYYEVIVTCTGKGYKSNQEPYQRFDHFTETFANKEEVTNWLKDRYGNCKRIKMYQDGEDGYSHHVGYIYCFNSADWSHTPVEKWRQRDWVEVRFVTAVPEP